MEPDKPYVKTAMFGSDDVALSAYSKAQAILFGADCDLSAYRIRYENVPHVVVLGLRPPIEIDQRLTETLATGKAAQLPQHIVTTLTQRRMQAKRVGPWVEGHYRPERPM